MEYALVNIILGDLLEEVESQMVVKHMIKKMVSLYIRDIKKEKRPLGSSSGCLVRKKTDLIFWTHLNFGISAIEWCNIDNILFDFFKLTVKLYS